MKNILKYQPTVLAGLEQFLNDRRQDGTATWEADVIGRLHGFISGGKLLRGSLVCYSYAICGGRVRPPKHVLQTAMALELMHAALLIHDDIIDQDKLRRGQPSFHHQYRLLGLKDNIKGADHFGESMALCAGDAAIFLALELLGKTPSSSNSPAVCALFARILATTCGGQMQDVYLGSKAQPPTKREVYAIMKAKTAGYSVALPLRSGALLASQPVAVQGILEALGEVLGTIYQIRDDELGTFGQTAQTGKPVGSDIRDGKKTLLYYYLWQSTGAEEQFYLRTVFGNPAAHTSDIAKVQAMMQQHKVAQRIDQEVRRLGLSAQKHIAKLPLPESAKDELTELAAFCAQREA